MHYLEHNITYFESNLYTDGGESKKQKQDKQNKKTKTTNVYVNSVNPKMYMQN